MALLALLLITTTDPVIYLTKILSWFGILVNAVKSNKELGTVESKFVGKLWQTSERANSCRLFEGKLVGKKTI